MHKSQPQQLNVLYKIPRTLKAHTNTHKHDLFKPILIYTVLNMSYTHLKL